MKKYSVVIAGGGSTYTPEIVICLLDQAKRFPIRSLRLYDNDPERQKVIADACSVLIRERDPSIKFIATDDPEKAYSDVDFCFAQIRVGGLKMREKDEKIHFVLEKEADGRDDPGFSIHRVSCPTCGGSFDAMHRIHCPYCGNPYDLKKKDWIIKDMWKAYI